MNSSTGLVCLLLASMLLATCKPAPVHCTNEDYLNGANQQDIEFNVNEVTKQRQQQQLANNLSQADKIKLVLRRYLQLQEQQGDQQSMFNQIEPARIQTRSESANSDKQSAQAIIDKWLESTIFELSKKSMDSNNNQKEAQDLAAAAAASSSSTLNSLLPGSYKSIRNIQPVIMRLPPRFGKRSLD